MSGLSSGGGLSGGASGGTSALWQPTSYTSTIPLDSLRYMPEQTVAGAITFTAGSSPAAGAQCYVVLIADGSHAPTFSGMKESGYSSGYNNTSGIENEITFWYDGSYVWYSVSQEVNAVAVTNPSVSSAGTTSTTTIDATFSAALNTTAPATSAFMLTASGGAASISNVSISGAVVTLTIGRTLASSETISLAYTKPGANNLKSAAGGFEVANFSGQSVTNNIVGAPTVSSAGTTDATHIGVVFSVALNASSTPSTSAFALTASGGAASISAVSISSATVTLTIGRSIAAGETLSLAYTAPGSNMLQNAGATANVANFSGQSVTNNVTAGDAVLRFTTRTANFSETADGTFGYNYVGTGAATAYNDTGVTSTGLPSSADGYAGFVVGSLANSYQGGIIGFKTSSSNGNFSTFAYGVYPDNGTSHYLCVTGGTGAGNPDTSVTPAVNDVVRLRRSGTSIYAEVSKNGGSSWAIVKTWTGDGGSKYYAGGVSGALEQMKQVFSSSNWA